MSTTSFFINKISESALFTLLSKAEDYKKKNSLLKDKEAFRLLEDLNLNLSKYSGRLITKQGIVIRSKAFDKYTIEFIEKKENPVIIMLGCGLDTRYQRISPLCKKAKFYYVDLEEVIEVRRYFLPPGSNEHLIPCSMFDLAWWAGITTQERNSDYLIIVEGVLVYFSAEENKKFINLVSSVASGAELVFDIVCNDLIDNYRQKEKDTLLKFGLDDISQLESWEERLKISKIIDLKDCAGYKAMLALIKQHNLENMKYSTKLVVTKIN